MRGQFVAYDASSGNALWKFDAQTGIIAQPITYLVHGRQYVTVLSGVSATPGIMAGLGGVPAWDYRTQKRRVLTFALDGKAVLPAIKQVTASAEPKILHFSTDAGLAAKGAIIYGRKCSLCHGNSTRAGGSAPDLKQSGVVADEPTFIQVVRGGLLKGSGMPQFQLSDEQLKALRHYIGKEAH